MTVGPFSQAGTHFHTLTCSGVETASNWTTLTVISPGGGSGGGSSYGSARAGPRRQGRLGAMRYELLIFDWDGTLADSAGSIVSAMQRAIEALGLPPREDAAIRELIGLGLSDALARLYPELDTPDLLRLLEQYRHTAPAALMHEAPLFPGARETLETLHAQGYLLAVATGKSRPGMNRSLRAHPYLQDLLAASRCADETAPKPDPAMLRELLDETGIAAERALMVGDTEYDMAMATAIGMPALGVACGVHASSRLRAAGARSVIEDLRALPAWLAAQGRR